MLWTSRAPTPPRNAVHTDVGPVRQENEDASGAFGPEDGQPGDHLFVVADGMGGHAHGREASAMALEVVRSGFFGHEGGAERRLESAFADANRRVWEAAHRNGRVEVMGTTCTALAFADGRAFVAHVGDSRAYRLDGGRLQRLTRDHTLVEELVRTGALTDDEAQAHPRRHALLRALGIAPEVEVDLVRVGPLRRGDRFLLCSDGLAPVPEREIGDVLLREAPEAACRTLVARAAAAGSTDNATAIVVAL